MPEKLFSGPGWYPRLVCPLRVLDEKSFGKVLVGIRTLFKKMFLPVTMIHAATKEEDTFVIRIYMEKEMIRLAFKQIECNGFITFAILFVGDSRLFSGTSFILEV